MTTSCTDSEVVLVCGTDPAGVSRTLREVLVLNGDGTPKATYYIDAADPLNPIDVTGWTISAGQCPRKLYTQRYRLAWDVIGAATPETTLGSPAGAVDLVVGNVVTIAPGWVNCQWYFEPETALNAVAIEDGRAYVVSGGIAYNQLQVFGEGSYSNDVMSHEVRLEAANGAFIELKVVRPV